MALDAVWDVDSHKLFHEVYANVKEPDSVVEDNVADIVAAHTKLMAELMLDVETRIRDASAQNLRYLDIMTFHGSEVYDGYSKLCMAVGPRDRMLRQEYRILGVDPLLVRLRRALFPFSVHHIWHPYTNQNILRVSW